ncbi:MAG: excinuclease ABC subunit UvrA, partial [Planctomycetota bacterium]
MVLKDIVIKGAREHNLKGIDLQIPRDALVTITGVSGSGKSSLAFDTIFKEGQRRFVESLSTYARQFLGRMDKPRVEYMEGLSPTVSIDQHSINRNPRSTVGTITEIYDCFRLQYARIGIPHCPECGKEVEAHGPDRIVDRIMENPAGTRIEVMAPVVRERKGEYRKELASYRLNGYVRARIDGVERRLDEEIRLERYKKHTIELILDRIRLAPERRSRVSEAVESALQMAEGVVSIAVGDEIRTYSSRLACPDCDIDIPEMEPRMFSFNAPQGACPRCHGLGMVKRIDPDRLVPDPSLSINGGAIRTMTRSGYLAYSRLGPQSLAKVAKHFGFSLDQPWSTLSKKQQEILLFGSGEEKIRLAFEWESNSSSLRVKGVDNKPIRGIIPTMEEAYRFSHASHMEKFFTTQTCTECKGFRLRPEALSVSFRNMKIHELAAMSVGEAHDFYSRLELQGREALIGRDLKAEIVRRLEFLRGVGLGYLRLDRSASSLSGGEAQRVRLAAQVASGLQGVVYVLDEPSIGLHPRDNRKLISTLQNLRDRGNTVFVVEHDKEMMLASDYLIDIGPGAGRLGGEVVAEGYMPEVIHDYDTATTQYLTERREIPVPKQRRPITGQALSLRGARQFNLKKVDARIPLKAITVVTGVSGSGKSTLIEETLVPAMHRKLGLRRDEQVGAHDDLSGWEEIERVVDVDQSPIGRTPRSNPATYTKVFGLIRDVFAACTEARARGYDKGRFSFNKKGGRCEACQGAGSIEVEMQFLSNVIIPCEECNSRRYNRETLEIVYRGKNICDVLNLSINEALDFFQNHTHIHRILQTLVDVGLGYMALGQPSSTLSGGEAQRVKLASELCRPASGRSLYVLDEPTTGLHFDDIRILLEALNRLVDRGNTMVIIEHNLDVIKTADYILDLGPEGGDEGGYIVASGTPEEVARMPRSRTGEALQELLGIKADPKPASKSRKLECAHRQVETELPQIRIRGARKNNLKALDVDLPHNALTVITGVSGSGKSSLAFDTLFAEGQRRFVESLSTYARRFLSRLDKVPVDHIEGLAPAIAIDQRSAIRSPRSTVATSTEVHDYLRLLFARVGQPHCPKCRKEIRAWSPAAAALDLKEKTYQGRALITAPLFRAGFHKELSLIRATGFKDLAPELLSQGFLRVLLDGREIRLDKEPALPSLDHIEAIDLVVDRVSLNSSGRTRLAEALESAFQQGHGAACVVPTEGEAASWYYLETAGCMECDFLLDELTPRMFSFNSHVGACSHCEGIGILERCPEEKLITDTNAPLLAGAIRGKVGEWAARPQGAVRAAVETLGEQFRFDDTTPWKKLSAPAKEALLHGKGIADHLLTVTLRRSTSSGGRREYTFEMPWHGLLHWVEEMYRNANEGWRKKVLSRYMEEGSCSACQGGRLKPEYLAVTVGGMNIQEISALSIDDALPFFKALRLQGVYRTISAEILKEIRNRLGFLKKVGLGYLALDRSSGSLSGGEAQRIRLASQLGNRLVGVLYVLDEPTIGLHPRDVNRLLKTLYDLRDLGNTVVVVEHDGECIRRADHLVDLGPGAGHLGGEVVYSGVPERIGEVRSSLTGAFLEGRRVVASPAATPRIATRTFGLREASRHNLKRIDVDFPAEQLVAVTGVSGSGKSTLIMDLLRKGLSRALAGKKERVPGLGRVVGVQHVNKLVVIDQTPIGRTPASNPATYTKAFDPVRELFASTPEARMRGFKAGHFSFNTGAGRCPACKGRGYEIVEMHFLSDVTLPCALCRGRRYNMETLSVRYRGANISDVLEMEISQAVEFFTHHKQILKILDVLRDVGLGYIKLGQPATTLSGGEAQRVKLASELCRPDTGSTVYLLDEPTTGLHFEDVRRLIQVLQMLVERKNTVIVIEHNLDLIASADHIIDLGPEGGDEGGRV